MDKPYVVGIDIGGTNSVFGVVDTRGNVLYNGSIKTGKYEDVNDYVRALGEGLQAVIRSAGGRDKIKGIGVGAPNGNYFNGCIEFAANLPWKGKVPLAQLISDRTGGIPVTLTNDAYIHEINRQYRGVDRPTDVISFALMESEEPEILDDPAGDVLGDLVISLERARAQAEEYGHSYLRELSFLTVHGMLHLLGYDHMEEEERLEMEEEQRYVMEELGIQR